MKAKPKRKAKERSKAKGDKSRPKDQLRRQVFEGVWHDLQRLGVLGNLAVGIILLLVGPVVLYLIQGLKGAVIAAGVGATLAVWLLVVIILRQIEPHLPPETETSGFLVPASDPDPPLPQGCPKLPDTWAIFYGNSVAFLKKQEVSIVVMSGQKLLSAVRNPEGLTISAKVFSPDGRIIAEIDSNEFTINQNNYFKRKRPDKSTLIVYDQMNTPVLSVRYLNRTSIRVTGIFRYGNRPPVIVTDSIMSMGSIVMSELCSGDPTTAVISSD